MTTDATKFHAAVMQHQPTTFSQAKATLEKARTMESKAGIISDAHQLLAAHGCPDPKSYSSSRATINSEEDGDLKFALLVGMAVQAQQDGSINEEDAAFYVINLALVILNLPIMPFTMDSYPHEVTF